jgi:S-adenosylmethionine:tRNA ribosyltransferase-isomerase
LHIGLSTFRPVKEEDILEHKMHSEYYEISEKSAEMINKAVKEGRRVISVGTTSGRVLETVADSDGFVKAGAGNTEIYIYPGYKFKIIKGMITNFHLPESTLIMYVSAFCGLENTISLYNTAVAEKYRFFSFGDATFLF